MGCDCGACVCHTMGIILMVSTLTMFGLGLACIAAFDPSVQWYTLGLAAFGVGGVLGLLLIGYTCFTMKRGWRLFGCCGHWESLKEAAIRRRAQQAYGTGSRTGTGTRSDTGTGTGTRSRVTPTPMPHPRPMTMSEPKPAPSHTGSSLRSSQSPLSGVIGMV